MKGGKDEEWCVCVCVGGRTQTGRRAGRANMAAGHDTRAPHSMPPCCHSLTHLTGKRRGTLLCDLVLPLPVTPHSPDSTVFQIYFDKYVTNRPVKGLERVVSPPPPCERKEFQILVASPVTYSGDGVQSRVSADAEV